MTAHIAVSFIREIPMKFLTFTPFTKIIGKRIRFEKSQKREEFADLSLVFLQGNTRF
jgi:hypothetical protein